jgi:RNA polymerase-binding transcription factor DksA
LLVLGEHSLVGQNKERSLPLTVMQLNLSKICEHRFGICEETEIELRTS